MASTESSPPRQQPVLSLLEKYSNLHKGIEEAREETAACQTKIEEAEIRIAKLMEERQLMTVQERAATEQQRQLLKDTDKALQGSLKLENDYEETLSRKHKAKALLESARQRERQYRQTFLDSSRAFRESCRQLCVRGEIAGVKPLETYSRVKGQQELLGAFLQEAQERDDDEKLHTEEMKELQERLEVKTKSFAAVKEERGTLCAKRLN
jgi:hypothetical protein